MNNETGPRAGRALRLAVATCLVAAPALGCSESHAVQHDAAVQPDAVAAPDAYVATDAAAEPDAAVVAQVDAGNDASTEWIEDAGLPEIPDAYYPDGFRG
jgi:hypothetical protein